MGLGKTSCFGAEECHQLQAKKLLLLTNFDMLIHIIHIHITFWSFRVHRQQTSLCAQTLGSQQNAIGKGQDIHKDNVLTVSRKTELEIISTSSTEGKPRNTNLYSKTCNKLMRTTLSKLNLTSKNQNDDTMD